MHSTHLRREAIHGLLVGTACGEAFGLLPTGICRKRRLRICRDRHGTLWPQVAIYGADTHLMLLAAQSVLNSCSIHRGFEKSFIRRLKWYPLSLPVGMSLATQWAASVGWLQWFEIPTGFYSTENSPLTRANFVALALTGTGHSLTKWIDGSTKLTHNHAKTAEACLVLGYLARIAATSKNKGLEPIEVLQFLIQKCRQQSLRDKLVVLAEQIEKRRSPRAVARTFKWSRRLPRDAQATVVMACYCFLRYPKDYYRAVNSASLLGGDRSTLCAVVGGLVGAHVGFASLPESVKNKVLPFPHGQDWMAEMSERMSHWPHGAEDLNGAPSLRSWPVMQLMRNLSHQLLRLIRFLVRLPCTILSLICWLRYR
jgi:ADP-ribosyl-[dinitrogen reductase] hydrolase